MAEHESITIAYVAEMMVIGYYLEGYINVYVHILITYMLLCFQDKIPIGYDDADETDDESEEACEASSGFLVFL